MSRPQIDQALKLLELDGAVAKTGGRWSRTVEPWNPDEERIARVIATRKRELVEMREYVTYTGCRMEYLTRLLDDPAAAPCGRARRLGKGLPRESHAVVDDAVEFLRRSLRPIAPRKHGRGRSRDHHCGAERGQRRAHLRRRAGAARSTRQARAGDSRRRSSPRRSGDPGPMAPRAAPEVGDGDPDARPLIDRRRLRGGGLDRSGVAITLPCLSTVADALPQRAMQGSVLEDRERAIHAVDRRLAGPRGAGPVDRRHRRLALDDNGGRGAAPRAGERPGVPVRAAAASAGDD